MDALLQSLSGFAWLWVIAAAFGGVLWGILGGALPGISPSIAMALLLPFTVGLPPTIAIVLLASVYVGAEYGGSIPAILIRTPGTNSASATVIDGFEMARQGKAGEALGISLMSGLVGGLFGVGAGHRKFGQSGFGFHAGCLFFVGRFGAFCDRQFVRWQLAQGLDRRLHRSHDRVHWQRPCFWGGTLHVWFCRSSGWGEAHHHHGGLVRCH
jgi:hypothetical protein